MGGLDISSILILYHERFGSAPPESISKAPKIRYVKCLSLSPSVNMPSFSGVIMIKIALAIVKRMAGWS